MGHTCRSGTITATSHVAVSLIGSLLFRMGRITPGRRPQASGGRGCWTQTVSYSVMLVPTLSCLSSQVAPQNLPKRKSWKSPFSGGDMSMEESPVESEITNRPAGVRKGYIGGIRP